VKASKESEGAKEIFLERVQVGPPETCLITVSSMNSSKGNPAIKRSLEHSCWCLSQSSDWQEYDWQYRLTVLHLSHW